MGAELALVFEGLPAGGVQALRPLPHQRLVDLEVRLQPGLEGEPLAAVLVGTAVRLLASVLPHVVLQTSTSG